ncbi:MAG: hypothetical protein ACN4EU_08490 [Brevundimonas mediterranea]
MTDVAEHDLTAEIARLRAELDAWKQRAAAAEAAADHDVLTPALNRRGFVGSRSLECRKLLRASIIVPSAPLRT